MAILIDTAELAGLAVEGVLYGIFLCLFCVCGYDLANRRGQFRRRLSWPMAAAGILLILFATARFAVDCANIFTAFIRHDPRTARLGYLQDVKEPLFTTKHCLFIADLLVGDSFVNYRCWVVWGKNFWVIVIPVTFSLVSAVSGSYTMWAYTNLPNEEIHTEATWLTVFFSLSLVANAMATSLLAYRIWSIDRRLKNALDTEADQSRLTPIVRIILESGLINAAYLFVMVMTLEFGSEILELMSEMRSNTNTARGYRRSRSRVSSSRSSSCASGSSGTTIASTRRSGLRRSPGRALRSVCPRQTRQRRASPRAGRWACRSRSMCMTVLRRRGTGVRRTR